MKTFATYLGRMAAVVLLAGVASALLVRFSPGSLVDVRELDPRMGAETVAALRAERAAENNLRAGFVRFLRQAAKGDLGMSSSLNAPITELLRQNAPDTVRRIAWGLVGGWSLGLCLAVLVARFERAWAIDALSALAAGALLSLPAAVIAYFALVTGSPVELALVLVLAPRVFRYCRNLLVQAYGAPHVEMARARGVGEGRILLGHVLPAAGVQLVALAAVSVTMAVGAIIPVEAICDAPGLGRLAWQAAMARDLVLLVNLTMVIALVTVSAMTLSELASKPEVRSVT